MSESEQPTESIEATESDEATHDSEDTTALQDADMASEGGGQAAVDPLDEDGDGRDEADGDDGEREGDTSGAGETRSLQESLEQEGEIAADYLEELLDIADLDGDLDLDVEGERALVSIVGGELQQLVGDQGRVLDALQELTRLAVYRETGERSRLMLDIAGHRAARRVELEELAASTVSEVKASGESASLRPMTPFERKVVHDAVASAGLTSESEGVEPRRYVVVLPV